MWLRRLYAHRGGHRVIVFSSCQFNGGHLCDARQGNRGHCVWSVCSLRRPGALPQTFQPVSIKGFVLFLYFAFLITINEEMCTMFFTPAAEFHISVAKRIYTWELPTTTILNIYQNKRVFFGKGLYYDMPLMSNIGIWLSFIRQNKHN